MRTPGGQRNATNHGDATGEAVGTRGVEAAPAAEWVSTSGWAVAPPQLVTPVVLTQYLINQQGQLFYDKSTETNCIVKCTLTTFLLSLG